MKIERLSATDIVKTSAYEEASVDIRRLINKNSVLFNTPFEEQHSNLLSFEKKVKRSEFDTNLLKESKKSYKKNKNEALKAEFTEVIVKSNPKMNINLKISK